MKTVYSILLFVLFYSFESTSQVPQAIPYQAVARTSAGVIVANQNISVRFGIYSALVGGTLIYQERQNVTTNSLGLFTSNVGQGIVLSGAFSSIVWSTGNKYIEVEIDITGGNSFTTMGRSQLLSVPYSLFSEKTSGLPNGTSSGQILIWNGLQWVAGNLCSLFNSDVNNCGSCNNVCPPNPANGTSACVNGVCTVICNTGFGNCDGLVANGCEVNLNSNPNNCTACGTICPPKPNATVTCTNGVCSFFCNPGFADCNNNPTDGCEVNLNTSTSNCGACGNVCPAGQSCVNGVCTTTCPSGQTLCSGVCTNVQTSVTNCGGCGIVCPNPPNAQSICVAGVCSFICNAGFLNCDGLSANGCEVNINTSSANCGGCGTVCPSGQTCVNGVCTASCPSGQTLCGGICINLNTNVINCGGCGIVCPTVANATTTCIAGICSFTCNAGFANCNGNSADGCEVNLTNNNNNCGSCGLVCPSGQSCSGGGCH